MQQGPPPNANDMNPMLMQALSSLQPEQFPMVMMSNPEMFP